MAPAPVDGLRIQVPALGIDLKIVEGDGWEPPVNLAAHYPGMKWPGQGGRSFIYAHARPGMFGPLFQAAVGQKVVVAQPDGRRINYTIREYYPAWPVANTSILQPLNHEELVLYTCTSWTYNDPKIVAIAEPD
ncbi:MAG: sortase [Candidatus Dormibacteraeota bacterium]|nr:sortase [Candidatus Dormibacteraeota bacterium]